MKFNKKMLRQATAFNSWTAEVKSLQTLALMLHRAGNGGSPRYPAMVERPPQPFVLFEGAAAMSLNRPGSLDSGRAVRKLLTPADPRGSRPAADFDAPAACCRK
jgi:hypothetical protein